jgi:ABC-type transport system involved in multi-copper enzyme maturation permease subunit
MLWRLIRKEILEHMMSLRFAIACLLCFGVILATLFVRGQEFRLAQGDYNEDSVGNREAVNKLDHPWRIIWRGLAEDKAPNPLKVFVRGVEDGNRLTVRYNGHRWLEIFGEEDRSPLLYLFPAMDLIGFVGLIMSLLAIVFGYDAVCGEKERGTLALMLSYSVPRDRVILAKWLGGYVSLIVPFLLTSICGAAIVLAQPEVALTASQWARLAAICGLALLYIAVIYGLAVWVSGLAWRGATSVLVLVTLWMVFVLIVPNLSPYLARVWRPTRNPLEIEQARSRAYMEIWTRVVTEPMAAYDKEHGFGERWWEQIDWSKWDERRIKAAQRRVYELGLEKKANLERLDTYAKLEQGFQPELDAQTAASEWISRLSPFACFAMAATELTDTGALSKQRFIDQMRQHQRLLCVYAADEWIALDGYELDHNGKSAPRWIKENRKKPIPTFAFAPPAGREYFREALLDAGILAGAALVLFLLSTVAFLRYDVR